jgi:hypothetical protein
VSSEGDAQKDLALNPEDAENVVGGMIVGRFRRKAKKAKHAVHKAAGQSGPGLTTQYSTDPAVDPVADEYGPGADTPQSDAAADE